MRHVHSQLWILALASLASLPVGEVRAQSGAPPTSPVDSVVLQRVDARGQAGSRTVLRRRTVAAGALEQLVQEAASIGFYRLPVNLVGAVPYCRTIVSDAGDATLTFFHNGARHSVGGYHHCGSPSPTLDSLKRLEVHVQRRSLQPLSRANMSVMRDSCPLAPERPRFEVQVQRPARWIARDDRVPRPDASLEERPPYSASYALAQFVVDTSGRPERETLKMLALPAGLARETVVHSMKAWRFAPARVKGCPVAQLVQIPLRWKSAR